MKNKKTYIYYDITRIIQRGNQVMTPTGIDRVDIHYAIRMVKDNDYITIGAYVYKGRILYLSYKLTEKIIQTVYNKWITCNVTDISHKEKMKQLIKEVQNEKRQTILGSKNIVDQQFILNKDKNSFYVNVSSANTELIDLWSTFKKCSNTKLIFFLHDLLPLEFPEYFWDKWDGLYLSRMQSLAKYSDMVVTVSEDVKSKFKNLVELLNIKSPSVIAIQNGIENKFIENRHQKQKNTSIENQFVIVSTIEPRKNHLMLLEIWRSLINEEYTNIPKLIIIGKRGWDNQNTFNLLDKSPALKQYVQEYNDLTDHEMIETIKKSRAMLFPSYGEGWGLPLVEAIMLGIPVICSDLPVLRESTQGFAEYIDVNDKKLWMHKIKKYTEKSDNELNIIKNNLNKFLARTWEKSFSMLKDNIKKHDLIEHNPFNRHKQNNESIYQIEYKHNDHATFQAL